MSRGHVLGGAAAAALWAALPDVSERTVAAVVAEVPEYAAQLTSGELGALRQAVHQALAVFVRRATTASELGAPAAGLDAAHALGRGEARSGRTMDALLAAYRVGARASWREWVSVLERHGVGAGEVAGFAELVFTYIDELSAASVAGHADELAATGRAREQLRERLGRALLAGEPEERLVAAAQRASWEPPATLTAVSVPSERLRRVLSLLDPGTLVAGDVVAVPGGEDSSLLLVPAASGGRARLLASLRPHPVTVGPSRHWTDVAASARRVEQARRTLPAPVAGPIDTDDHLVELLLGADTDTLSDLRARALAPLARHRPATAQRLAATLRSWLLHQGRRDDVAEHLHIHPQTVRYRMTQIREAYGELLATPEHVVELMVALAVEPALAAAADEPSPGRCPTSGRDDREVAAR